ncbi:MAG: hypothetical protein ACE5EK_05980 [Nitrospinales bacterium]
MPKIEALANLTQGVSNLEDIRLALGEPRARGMSRWAANPEIPLKIWEYQFTKAGGGQAHLTILLVFIREDHYDGHLWFSAEEKFKSKVLELGVGDKSP